LVYFATTDIFAEKYLEVSGIIPIFAPCYIHLLRGGGHGLRTEYKQFYINQTIKN